MSYWFLLQYIYILYVELHLQKKKIVKLNIFFELRFYLAAKILNRNMHGDS